MILPVEGDETSGWKPGKPYMFVKGSPIASEPEFSPDGRWVAYFTLGAGPPEVFVQPFPGPGGKRQISTGGGMHPVWSRSGRELFFHSSDQQIMVAAISVQGDVLNADRPQRWSNTRPLVRPRGFISAPGRSFDVHPDGLRIAGAFATAQEATSQDHVTLVFNFFDELKRIAPRK